jgi:DNA-binding HxlR family transcriptional regulator
MKKSKQNELRKARQAKQTNRNWIQKLTDACEGFFLDIFDTIGLWAFVDWYLKKQEAMRYSEIQAAIPDISQKMLTVTLKNLEADGLVRREAFAEIPPRVEYSITERGKSLMPHINSLIDWALNNLAAIMNDRKKYNTK